MHSSQIPQAVAERVVKKSREVTIETTTFIQRMWKLGLDWGAKAELISGNETLEMNTGEKSRRIDEKGPPLTSGPQVWYGDIQRWRKLKEDGQGHVSGLSSQKGTLTKNRNHNDQSL